MVPRTAQELVAPCMNSVVGASHDKYHGRWGRSARATADREIIKKHASDVKRGSTCVSHNFLRAVDDRSAEEKAEDPEGFIDYGNKNIIPLDLDNIFPIGVFRPLTNIMLGMRVAAVSTYELVPFLGAFWKCEHIPKRNIDGLSFVYEGAVPSLGRTILGGAKDLHMRLGDRFGFHPADVPFDLTLESTVDPDWNDHGVVMSLNTLEALMTSDGRKITNRNPYHLFGDTKIKEPNDWFLSEKSLAMIQKVADVANGSRKGGGFGFKEIAKIAGKELWRDRKRLDQHTRDVLKAAAINYLKSKLGMNRPIYFDAESGAEIGKYVFGDSTLVKDTHRNPWMVWDIDSEEDLVGYKAVIQYAMHKSGARNFGDLTMIYPYADILWSMCEKMRAAAERVPYVKNFAELQNARCEKVGMEPYHDDQGKFIGEPTNCTDVEAGFDSLVEQAAKFRENLIEYKKQGLFLDAVVPN